MRNAMAILLLFISSTALAGGGDPVQLANARVADIQVAVDSGALPVIEIKEFIESEGRPPEFQFYYDVDRLVVAYVVVGHETWLSRYSYYFYPNGNPIKFVEEIVDRPDNPPRKATIFDEDGKVIWSNMETEKVDPAEVQGLFGRYWGIRNMFWRGY